MFERISKVIGNIGKIPELRQRILFTLGMLAVYRIGAYIPTPGVNGNALSAYLHQNGGALIGFFDMFSGGALSRLTIFALGIMPYISASIILQLLTVVHPSLQALAKEGERGRKVITKYTRYLTVLIALIQSFGIAIGLESMNRGQFVPHPGWPFRILVVITLTTATTFIMWLGEQITERGVGNGISLIIFSGIIARLPSAILNTYKLYNQGEISGFLIIGLVVMVAVIVGSIVFIETARRKVPVQYAKRLVGNKMMGGQSTYIPLKINTAGVIPPIFASSLIAFPATIASFITLPWIQNIGKSLAPGSFSYTLLYVLLIIFFSFFYTAVVLNPADIAENMQKYGGYIPGIRPGQNTSTFFYGIMNRITLVGALYLSLVCVVPELLIYKLHVPFYFGGTSLLIVIGVSLDTAQQIESYMMSKNYDGFLKKTRIKGRAS
ncbi:preprotein translocase subunit SecY [Leptospirillum ferrooxidans]|uniref:Protein translocase subunit SecY n=1 Tax=Leptospirillum ferrooxidans (strain C2-3) TaxID=1162668 RepID=I0IMV7_LEPFC|nr:preprotein translocase subunit SecY [Leptospirillum ferrooxidans]BAM06606.1 preprotein translocase subunit [Leptospirillum ferrooxidans C2-3]